MSEPVYFNYGHCLTCDHDVRFNLWEGRYREGYLCARCASVPRERALMEAIELFYPNWRELQIHESSPAPRGASLKLKEGCPQYISTQYHPTVPEGELHPGEGWRCENLERQTFADNSFDLVITQDVLEHVFDVDAVLRDIARTLKPGGAHILTTPLVRGAQPSMVCAEMNADGSVNHHVDPPEYHGNPVDGSGSLVTWWWGYDLANRIDRVAPFNTMIRHVVDQSKGIDGPLNEVLVSFKI